MPTSSRLSSNCSVFNALFPDISIAEIEGLSITEIIKVFPSSSLAIIDFLELPLITLFLDLFLRNFLTQ